MHNQKAIARNVLNAYLGAKTAPKVLAGQIRRAQTCAASPRVPTDGRAIA
jgi:hypothetical protein